MPKATKAAAANHSIRLGVMVRDASGAPDFYFCSLVASPAEISDGEHYSRAMDLARERHYEPIVAFDENDPAWAAVSRHIPYESFYDEAVLRLQDAIVDGRDPSGADTIDEVARLFEQQSPRDDVYIAVSMDGFWNNTDGWVGEALHAHLSPHAEPLQDLVGTDVHVVRLSLRAILTDGLLNDIPAIDQIIDAAEDALARARKHAFTIEASNANEVLSEELALAQVDTSKLGSFAQFFGAVMAKAQAELAEAKEGGDRPRG